MTGPAAEPYTAEWIPPGVIFGEVPGTAMARVPTDVGCGQESPSGYVCLGRLMHPGPHAAYEPGVLPKIVADAPQIVALWFPVAAIELREAGGELAVYHSPSSWSCRHCGGEGAPAPSHAHGCPWWGAGQLAMSRPVIAAREVMADEFYAHGRGADVAHLREVLAAVLAAVDQAGSGRLAVGL